VTVKHLTLHRHSASKYVGLEPLAKINSTGQAAAPALAAAADFDLAAGLAGLIGFGLARTFA
jgi:hypothetical protein